jgi:hypothetical protein
MTPLLSLLTRESSLGSVEAGCQVSQEKEGSYSRGDGQSVGRLDQRLGPGEHRRGELVGL